ncbi:hypothetical protein [Eikenella corrodens]|uniref:hypothetical protein n=1 Tax=Eikenella corrodens TaxID=539 RepID=UPI00129B3365|nr:hypothetical protein [Eikenella corrodens]
MPSNTNHVCFHCCTAVRRAKTHGQAVLCPECGHTCTRLSYKLAIPPKHQPKAWQALQNKIQAYHAGQAAHADQMQQRSKAELQQRIARLKQQAKQPGCGSKEHERLSRQLAEARHKLGQIQRQQYISNTLELS